MFKKIAAILIVGFAIFWVLSQPEGAADSVKGAFDGVMEGFRQFGRFVDRLFA